MSNPLTLSDLLLRMGLALLCGISVGLNRDLHHKPAGFRTFGLVSAGSALAVLATELGNPGDLAAVSRVMQGILTGIGFVGAGVIFRRDTGKRVSGLTTAAAIWFAAALGITCGQGHFALALVGLAVALLVLIVGGPIERYFERLLGEAHDGVSARHKDHDHDDHGAPP
jgi:putative Mg2+ transporter-C (MgtC) family protein